MGVLGSGLGFAALGPGYSPSANSGMTGGALGLTPKAGMTEVTKLGVPEKTALSNDMVGLDPTIQPSAGARGEMDPRDKPEDDTCCADISR
jgi:hypothetical protein